MAKMLHDQDTETGKHLFEKASDHLGILENDLDDLPIRVANTIENAAASPPGQTRRAFQRRRGIPHQRNTKGRPHAQSG